MSDQNPWNDLFADSMRTFGDIEALGRQLAGSIAAEFAAHTQTNAPGADADRRSEAIPKRVGSLNDMTHDLLTWIDAFSDMARDTVFALADAATTAVGDVAGLHATAQAPSTVVPFWLHSSIGSASQIRPTVSVLTSASGDQLVARIEPPIGDVDPEQPTAFAVLVDAPIGSPTGTYVGTITADLVPDAISITVDVPIPTSGVVGP